MTATSPNHTFPAAAPLPRPLSGIVPPMITPLTGPDQLDLAGLERLIEHILAGGVHGLFVLGTSGEAPNLSNRLKRELIERTCRQVKGRVPVIVGITDTSLIEAQNLARHAAEAGACAVVTSTPYYFPLHQSELSRYVERLLPALALPLFLYNIPQVTRSQFGIDLVRRFMDQEKIVGVKDSSGDLNAFKLFADLRLGRPEYSVLVGPEHLLAESLRLGGCGGINGGANFHPRLFVGLYEAVTRGDSSEANRLQAELETLGEIYSVGSGSTAFIKGMKCACSLLGICDDAMTDALAPLSTAERARVRSTLQRIGLLS
jgi:2-dehydro-3-deoxy-D-pentonate aldolase